MKGLMFGVVGFGTDGARVLSGVSYGLEVYKKRAADLPDTLLFGICYRRWWSMWYKGRTPNNKNPMHNTEPTDLFGWCQEYVRENPDCTVAAAVGFGSAKVSSESRRSASILAVRVARRGAPDRYTGPDRSAPLTKAQKRAEKARTTKREKPRTDAKRYYTDPGTKWANDVWASLGGPFRMPSSSYEANPATIVERAELLGMCMADVHPDEVLFGTRSEVKRVNPNTIRIRRLVAMRRLQAHRSGVHPIGVVRKPEPNPTVIPNWKRFGKPDPTPAPLPGPTYYPYPYYAPNGEAYQVRRPDKPKARVKAKKIA